MIRRNLLPPFILVVSLLILYWHTLAPGLTWANDGSDGGDLIAAAATGGVPHPTGYPLYLVVARVFQLLPIRSLAFRTNLLSAIATAAAAGLVYSLAAQAASQSHKERDWIAGLAAGYAFGLAPLIWSQAVITEVYALQSLMLAIVLRLYAVPAQSGSARRKGLDRWRGVAMGLAACNHVTIALLAPIAFVAGSIHRKAIAEDEQDIEPGRSWYGNLEINWGALLRQLVLFAAGLSLYLILPIRALAQPPVSWGTVVTPARLWWLVSGQLYQSYYLQFTPTELWHRIQAWAALLLQQFGLPGVILGLLGLIVFGKRSRLFILTVWTAGIFTLFAIVYGSLDSYVYLIPVFLSFSVWIGLGIAGVGHQFVRWSPMLKTGLLLLLLSYLAARSTINIQQVDASNDVRAESFGREVLSVVPENAILFAEGDRSVFALWYFHFALGERPDLAILAADMLHFDWYQENLRATYPALVVPGPFPWPETIAQANASRPICYVDYADHTTVNCTPGIASP